MLMAIDVGNTNIAVGFYEGDKVVNSFRMVTREDRTSDELGAEFYSIIHAKRMRLEDVNAVMISSVVPNLNHALVSCVIKYFGVEPMMVSLDLETGIQSPVKDLGADRIVDATAAHKLYGPEVMVVDFGTATTYDYIDAQGDFVNGITAPGLRIEADALTNMTAQLPKIEIVKPESVLARDTITSMQVGVVYGYIGSVEYIIQAVKDEIGHNFPVIATGGLGTVICPYTKAIDVYDPDLAYKGMKILWDLNH